MAKSLERALLVALWTAIAARLHHSDVTEREIEAHGIIGIDRAQ